MHSKYGTTSVDLFMVVLSRYGDTDEHTQADTYGKRCAECGLLLLHAFHHLRRLRFKRGTDSRKRLQRVAQLAHGKKTWGGE